MFRLANLGNDLTLMRIFAPVVMDAVPAPEPEGGAWLRRRGHFLCLADLTVVATLAQAASAAYYLESQRSFRHPNEYYTAGEKSRTGCGSIPRASSAWRMAARSTAATSTGCITASPRDGGGKLTRNAGSERRSAGLDHDLQRGQERLGLVGGRRPRPACGNRAGA